MPSSLIMGISLNNCSSFENLGGNSSIGCSFGKKPFFMPISNCVFDGDLDFDKNSDLLKTGVVEKRRPPYFI